MKNIDKIKNMNSDEMAIFLDIHTDCDTCIVLEKCNNGNHKSCKNVIKQWLEGEAE